MLTEEYKNKTIRRFIKTVEKEVGPLFEMWRGEERYFGCKIVFKKSRYGYFGPVLYVEAQGGVEVGVFDMFDLLKFARRAA